MRSRFLLAALIVASTSLWSVHGADGRSAAAAPVTVFIVRHAEALEASAENRDPELAENGRERAAVLTRLLSKSGVTHVFTSEYARTRATLAELAAARDVEIEVVPARDGERQVNALRELEPGSVAVVAGHSNTVPQLVAALGAQASELVEKAPYGKILPHDAYDRLYVLTLPSTGDGVPAMFELRYGAE